MGTESQTTVSGTDETTLLRGLRDSRAKRRSYDELKQVIEANVESHEFQRGIAASLHEIERLRAWLMLISESENDDGAAALHALAGCEPPPTSEDVTNG